jgi:histidyl-tRNA synthetase
MAKLQPVRGTHDLLPDEARRHRRVIEVAREQAERYGFAEMATPVFEFTEVFQRTLGDTSDVVTKEMYTFTDRGGESITLRPEFTAGVVRSFLSEGLSQQLPVRFFSYGPLFRYERPQKGRLRQFHQVNVECIGIAEPQADVEVLALGHDILTALGIREDTTLEINSLGDSESRAAYRARLVAYFSGHAGALSEDSRARLERNPLRILDSKDEGDRAIVAGAPMLADSLNPASAEFFAAVRRGLDALGVAHKVNQRLVRGLDYYSHTAFEFVTSALGAQGAVMSGGRYDSLVESMGGPPTPGIGWAGGVERLAMLLGDLEAPRGAVALVPIGPAGEAKALVLAHELRGRGLRVDLAASGNLSKRMKRADKIGARVAVLLGDDELKKGVGVVRDLASGAQREVPLAELGATLARDAI